MAIAAGAFVRLKNDPGRTGTATGKLRKRGETSHYQVRFTEGPSWVPEYELEPVSDDTSDVYQLLQEGRYGSLNDLRRNLTHIQLTGRLANMVYSMDTTNTEFYAYQFKPVLSFLESPSNGLLLADEVGLGKTIEAGLIWTEIRARYDARRLLVVCPAMLREKWKAELGKRFSVQAEVLNARELLQELQRDRSSVPDGKAFVCGMQSIRPPRLDDEDQYPETPTGRLAKFLEDAAEEEPLIDLVIIDESHYMRNSETQNSKLGHLLRAVTDHIVLLSATPINNKRDDLFQQLNLVDPDFFSHEGSFPDVLDANKPLWRARQHALDPNSTARDVLASLAEAQSHALLSDNGQLANLLQGTVSDELLASKAGRVRLANRIERINLLSHAVSRTRKVEVLELRVVREPKAYFVPMNDAERTVYDLVTETIVQYAEQSEVSAGFLLSGPQRQVSSCIYAAVKSWSGRADGMDQQVYEDLGVEVKKKDAAEVGPLRARLTRLVPQIDLDKLRQNDSKYEKFRQVVLDYLREHPEEKIVVFSFYTGTLNYLSQRLAEDGIRSAVLHGSVKRAKDDVIAEFRDTPNCRVLLASEVASEGVDLQFARVLVNYDLPWNPMKVEQRIGRIDRIGQNSDKISILNLLHADTIDHRIYTRLMEKLKIFEHALGGLDAVLGDEIKALTADLLSKRLTRQQQEQRIEQSASAVERIRLENERLEAEASTMIAHGGYILEQVQAARDFKKRVHATDLQIYVQDYLNRYSKGHLFHQTGEEELRFDVQLPLDLASKLASFIKQHKLHGQTNLATGRRQVCQFENKLKPAMPRQETISQFHPLIRFISDDLRQRNEAYYSLVAAKAEHFEVGDEAVAQGSYAFAVKRWSFSGLKQEEQLHVRAIHLDTGRMLSAEVSLEMLNHVRVSGRDWLDVGTLLSTDLVGDAIDVCAERIDTDYEQISTEKGLENRDRVNFQIKAAKQHRDRQLGVQQELLNRYRGTGRTRMIPALEGKIKRINERFDQKETQLKQKMELRRSYFDVSFGVVCLV